MSDEEVIIKKIRKGKVVNQIVIHEGSSSASSVKGPASDTKSVITNSEVTTTS